MMSTHISFIIPLFNEDLVFNALISRLQTFSASLNISHEFVLVDDGSQDATPRLMGELAVTDKRFHCIFLSRNFGHQYAVSAGLQYARCSEAAMILDGDLQDPPELFADFYSRFKEGFDVVFGIRRKRRESIWKKLGYFFFYRLLKRISDSPIDLDAGDFALISRRVVNILNNMPEGGRYLRGMRSWMGFRQTGVEYDREKRSAGNSKYSLKKLFQLAYDGIFNFSVFPIKLLTYTGFFCIASSLVYFLVTLFRRFILGDVPVGFTGLLFMIIFFGGVQLLSIGIIGEYVFRIFNQVKGRPLYIVKSRIINGESIFE
jgi:dolichol-phosphate mannosyltransferase